MHEFKHPKYYKELRKRNKSDQAISDEAATAATSVRPGPGPSTSLGCRGGPSNKQQATSAKLQATSNKRSLE